VSYVNTSAAVKAESDLCCTSANAVQVVQSLPTDREIIFTPDRNLGGWIIKQTGRPMLLWEGFCPTHELIELEDALTAKREHPGAKLVVHPECRSEVSDVADAVESTSGMLRFCKEDEAEEFIIGTESGMIYRLQQDIPGKTFHAVTDMAVCPNMKLTTLEKAARALEQEEPVISVPEDIRLAALRAVERMVAIGR
jgi:quinolinate synthase